MDAMIARVLVALVGIAVVLGGLLLVLSFFVPSLRWVSRSLVALMTYTAHYVRDSDLPERCRKERAQ